MGKLCIGNTIECAVLKKARAPSYKI